MVDMSAEEREGTPSLPPLPPPVSPDGRFWWDGDQWVAFHAQSTTAPTDHPSVADGVAGGISKFVLGLLLLPLLLLVPLMIWQVASGAFVFLVPLTLGGVIAYWYIKRLR